MASGFGATPLPMRHPFLPTTLLALTASSPVSLADVLTLEPAKDNTLYEDPAGSLSNGAGDYIFSGKDGVGTVRRALLWFDLASSLPAGSTIETVELTLNMNMTIASPQPISLHRVLAGWGEGDSHAFGQEGGGGPAQAGDATWLHTFYPGQFWGLVGGDFDPVPHTTTSVGSNGNYTWNSTPSMVADLQSWLDDPATNFGWMLKHDNENPNTTAKRFASREHPSPSLRPRIEIQFTPPATCASTRYCASLPNSTGFEAQVYIAGDCSIAAGDFMVGAVPVPDQPGIFFFGNSQLQISFGNGFLCTGGGIVRLKPVVVAADNYASLSVDLTALGLTPGTKNFQFWFRDPSGGGAGFNLTDGLAVTIVP